MSGLCFPHAPQERLKRMTVLDVFLGKCVHNLSATQSARWFPTSESPQGLMLAHATARILASSHLDSVLNFMGMADPPGGVN